MKNNFEDLPVFESYPFFDEDIEVYEIALITYKKPPQTFRPYNPQNVLGVFGRDPSSKFIYAALGWMLLEDGKMIALPVLQPYSNTIETNNIEDYEILIPHNE